MHPRLYIIFLFLLTSFVGFGQVIKVPDSLKNITYEELREKFNDRIEYDSIVAKLYAKAYLNRGKNSFDSIKMITGLYYMSRIHANDFEKRITYLDSAITIAERNKEEKHLVWLKIHKGALLETAAFFDAALNNYLESYELAKKTNFSFYISALQHNIAVIKRKYGKYEEAKSLFKEALSFEKSNMGKEENDSLSYLMTLSDLAVTYRQNKQLDSSAVLSNMGFEMSKNKPIQSLFLLNKGILNYHDGNYKITIDNINQAVNILLKPENRKNYAAAYDFMDAYFFLGKSYDALSKKELSIVYYKKIDSLLQKTNYIIPKVRPAYFEIINYYESMGDKNNQLYYINRLLYNDSIIDLNFRDISNKLTKEFDTPQLIAEKEQIIAALEKENTKISSQNLFILILLVISIFGGGYYYYRQRLYKKRFLKLLDKTTKSTQKRDQPDTNPSEASSINKETLNHLLDQLQQFEEKQGYLKSNLNAKDLAKSFGSNASYLSKVVNTFKEKNFTSYINDLRINYVIGKLKEDRIFRKYTVKAIAQDIGFNNAEAFAKAFYKKTGIYPSYFIKELEKR